MLCDFLGAGRAYSGKKFTYTGELEWWKKKIENPLAMHQVQKYFINCALTLAAIKKDVPSPETLKEIYEESVGVFHD